MTILEIRCDDATKDVCKFVMYQNDVMFQLNIVLYEFAGRIADIPVVITNCPDLQSVDFSNCTRLTDEMIATLWVHPTLTSAKFYRCDRLTDVAAVTLSTCPALQSVDFSGCTLMTRVAVVALKACPAITTAHFFRCGI